MRFTIEIAQDNDSWALYNEVNTALVQKVLNKVIEGYPNFQAINNIELSVLLTGDKRIQKLNQEFRNENKATNVLSFPDIEIDVKHILKFKPDLEYLYLGDIAFAFETIAMESKEKGIAFVHHFKHLLVHAILHLLGYDHQNDEEAEIMQNIEVNILKNFSISSPYLQ